MSTSIYWNTGSQVPPGTDQSALVGQSELKVPLKFVSPKGLWVPFPVKAGNRTVYHLTGDICETPGCCPTYPLGTMAHQAGVTNTSITLKNLGETVGFGFSLTDSQVKLRIHCTLLAEPHEHLMFWFFWQGEEMSFSIDPKQILSKKIWGNG